MKTCPDCGEPFGPTHHTLKSLVDKEKKIRELEAELRRLESGEVLRRTLARAEKAEAELAERREEYFVVVRERQDAMARVAELTRDKRNMAKVSCNNCGERVWADGEFPEFEAREREAADR